MAFIAKIAFLLLAAVTESSVFDPTDLITANVDRSQTQTEAYQRKYGLILTCEYYTMVLECARGPSAKTVTV